MLNLTSPKWWLNQFVTVFMTMCFIWVIKKFAGTYNIPVVSTVANEV